MKGKKDLSKLIKKTITDKNGITRIVWVKKEKKPVKIYNDKDKLIETQTDIPITLQRSEELSKITGILATDEKSLEYLESSNIRNYSKISVTRDNHKISLSSVDLNRGSSDERVVNSIALPIISSASNKPTDSSVLSKALGEGDVSLDFYRSHNRAIMINWVGKKEFESLNKLYESQSLDLQTQLGVSSALSFLQSVSSISSRNYILGWVLSHSNFSSKIGQKVKENLLEGLDLGLGSDTKNDKLFRELKLIGESSINISKVNSRLEIRARELEDTIAVINRVYKSALIPEHHEVLIKARELAEFHAGEYREIVSSLKGLSGIINLSQLTPNNCPKEIPKLYNFYKNYRSVNGIGEDSWVSDVLFNSGITNGMEAVFTGRLPVVDEDSLTLVSSLPKMKSNSVAKVISKNLSDKLFTNKIEGRKKVIEILEDYTKKSRESKESTPKADKEVKCTLKSLSAQEVEAIYDKLIKDWDNVNHSKFDIVIKGCYKIENLEHQKAYEKLVNEARTKNLTNKVKGKDYVQPLDPVEDYVYHGTSNYSGLRILGEHGKFRVPKASSEVKTGSMLGYGVYVSDCSSKSIQYCGDKFGSENIGLGSGTLFLCKASVGECIGHNSYSVLDDDMTTTVYGGKDNLLNNEWCIKDTNRVIPDILVDIEIKPKN